MLSKVAPVEHEDVLEVHEVDESIASVASVLEIDRKVKEVDDPWSVSVLLELGQEHLLRVLVGDVPHHERGSSVNAAFHRLQVEHQMAVVLVLAGGRRGPIREPRSQAGGVGRRHDVRVKGKSRSSVYWAPVIGVGRLRGLLEVAKALDLLR